MFRAELRTGSLPLILECFLLSSEDSASVVSVARKMQQHSGLVLPVYRLAGGRVVPILNCYPKCHTFRPSSRAFLLWRDYRQISGKL